MNDMQHRTWMSVRNGKIPTGVKVIWIQRLGKVKSDPYQPIDA